MMNNNSDFSSDGEYAAEIGLKRFVDAKKADTEENFQRQLRPQRLEEYVGQAAICAKLKIAISAAKRRGE